MSEATEIFCSHKNAAALLKTQLQSNNRMSWTDAIHVKFSVPDVSMKSPSFTSPPCSKEATDTSAGLVTMLLARHSPALDTWKVPQNISFIWNLKCLFKQEGVNRGLNEGCSLCVFCGVFFFYVTVKFTARLNLNNIR